MCSCSTIGQASLVIGAEAEEMGAVVADTKGAEVADTKGAEAE